MRKKLEINPIKPLEEEVTYSIAEDTDAIDADFSENDVAEDRSIAISKEFTNNVSDLKIKKEAMSFPSVQIERQASTDLSCIDISEGESIDISQIPKKSPRLGFSAFNSKGV